MLHLRIESSNSGKKQRGKKVEKKIAASYATASWELAGVQESCSIDLRKLGQPCVWLKVLQRPLLAEEKKNGHLESPDFTRVSRRAEHTGKRQRLTEGGWVGVSVVENVSVRQEGKKVTKEKDHNICGRKNTHEAVVQTTAQGCKRSE